jgi:7-carboxy-7-deazaguanine synthase
MLLINEVFQTIQGEAAYTGTPAVFLRLQGCPVGCPWCDTKYTWDSDVAPEPKEAIFTRKDQKGGLPWNEKDLLDALRAAYSARHLVLTGGEPASQDIYELCDLASEDFIVQLETSGTFEIKVPDSTFVTVSPKINMPGGRVVLDSAIERADEIKYPVGKLSDLEQLDKLLARTNPTCKIWLQPLSQSEKATALCVDICTQRNWRLSVQTHKYLNLP